MGRGFRVRLPLATDSNFDRERKIIGWFQDVPDAPFSVHKFVQAGVELSGMSPGGSRLVRLQRQEALRNWFLTFRSAVLTRALFQFPLVISPVAKSILYLTPIKIAPFYFCLA